MKSSRSFSKSRRHYQVRDELLLTAITGMGNSGGKVTPSVGIYYVVPMRERWYVMAYRYGDVTDELDHVRFWEEHVCLRLASSHSNRVAYPAKRLREVLEGYPHGFPRGRVARVGTTYHVYHGQDIPYGLGIDRHTIETIFGIEGKARWREDDHEHCLIADKEALREVLAPEEDWPAV